MRLLSVFGILVWMVTSSPVQAGFVLELDQTSYTNLTQGQVVNANVFVAATGASDIAAFSAINNGLQGVSFNLFGLGGDTIISTFTKNSALFGTQGVPAGTTLNQGPLAAVPFIQGNSVTGRVQIGTLSFTAGTVGSTTNYTFSDPAGGAVDNVTASLNGATVALDTQVFASPAARFTVTAVPEPSSMALLALVGVGGVAARRFRKKQQVIKNA